MITVAPAREGARLRSGEVPQGAAAPATSARSPTPRCPASCSARSTTWRPSSWAAATVDHRADLFSTGVVLYEMLAAKLPFPGTTLPEIADRILNHEPDAIARYNYARHRGRRDDPPQGAAEAARLPLSDGARLLHRSVERAAPASSRRFVVPRRRAPGSARSTSPTRRRRCRCRRRRVAPSSTCTVAVLNFANITGNAGRRLDRAGHRRIADRRPDAHQGDRRRAARADLRAAAQPQRARAAASTSVRPWSSAGGSARRWRSAAPISAWATGIRITAQAIEVARRPADRDREDRWQRRRSVRAAGSARHRADRGARRSKSQQQDRGGHRAWPAPSRWTPTRRTRAACSTCASPGRESMERAIALLRAGARARPELRRGDGRAGRRPGAQRARSSRCRSCFERSLALAEARVDASARRSRTRTCSVGDTLLAMGRADEAIAALQKGMRLQPDRAARHGSLARAYWLGKGQVDARHHGVRRDAAAQPGGRLHASAARACSTRCAATTRRPSSVAREAIRLQDQAMSGATGLIVVGAHSRLGYVHYRQGHYDEAIRRVPPRAGDAVGRRSPAARADEHRAAAEARRRLSAQRRCAHRGVSRERGDRAASTRGWRPAPTSLHALLHGGAACPARRGGAGAPASRAAAEGRGGVHALAPAARPDFDPVTPTSRSTSESSAAGSSFRAGGPSARERDPPSGRADAGRDARFRTCRSNSGRRGLQGDGPAIGTRTLPRPGSRPVHTSKRT